ncbi:MAG: hypothetical protein HY920_03160 [Elusimicrobia bacterium]|nr:hypothetical protein [Elusimicrobiota bacterium]
MSLLYAGITGSALAESMVPALVIENINFSEAQPFISQKEIILVINVKNTGTRLTSPETIAVIIEEGKTRAVGYRKLYKEFALAPLAAGEKKILELGYIPHATKATTGKAAAKLKSTPQAIQSISFQIIPEQKPDFRLDRIDLQPAKPFYETGEKITISPVWSADAGKLSPYDLKFFIDDRKVQDISYEVYLPIKENNDISMDYIFTQPGEHKIKVIINRDEVQNEVNRSNNEKELKVTIKSILPDLVMAKMELTKMPPIAGEVNKIKYTVTNIGRGASSRCLLELLILEDGKEVKRFYEDIPTLAGNGTYTKDLTYTFGASAKRMRIVGMVDSARAVSEVSRDNNQTFIRGNVEPPRGPVISTLSEEDMNKYTKIIMEVLEKLKKAESVKNIDDYMVTYSTDCAVTEPNIKDLNYETYKFRIADIFRQYDDIMRTYTIAGPICFTGNEFAVLNYAYKVEGIFREIRIKDTISEGMLVLTFRKEGESWKIFKQESNK